MYELLGDFRTAFLVPLVQDGVDHSTMLRAFAAVEEFLDGDDDFVAEAMYFGAIESLATVIDKVQVSDVGAHTAREIANTFPAWPGRKPH